MKIKNDKYVITEDDNNRAIRRAELSLAIANAIERASENTEFGALDEIDIAHVLSRMTFERIGRMKTK